MDDVPKAEQPEHIKPVLGALGHERQRHTNQTIESKLLQHASVEHRGAGWCGTVSQRRPRMKRPERHENTEPKHEQRKNPALRRNGHWLRLKIFCDARNAERAL